jgi:hypothetical protein
MKLNILVPPTGILTPTDEVVFSRKLRKYKNHDVILTGKVLTNWDYTKWVIGLFDLMLKYKERFKSITLLTDTYDHAKISWLQEHGLTHVSLAIHALNSKDNDRGYNIAEATKTIQEMGLDLKWVLIKTNWYNKISDAWVDATAQHYHVAYEWYKADNNPTLNLNGEIKNEK